MPLRVRLNAKLGRTPKRPPVLLDSLGSSLWGVLAEDKSHSEVGNLGEEVWFKGVALDVHIPHSAAEVD